MGDLTPILGLYQPANGETGWGDEVNNNTDILEERITGEVINVKDFGATGDGVTDDYQAIQDALDAVPTRSYDPYPSNFGAKVYIPSGQYRNATASWSPYGGTTVEGAGFSSILLNEVPGDGPLWDVDPVDPAGPFSFRYFKINGPGETHSGNRGTSGGPAFRLDHVLQVNISEITFDGVCDASHWAIDAVWAIETHIDRCVFLHCQGGGISLGDTCNASSIRDCTGSNNGDGAIGAVLIAGAEGILMSGNVWEAWRGDYVIKILSSTGNIIEREWFEDNYGPSILGGGNGQGWEATFIGIRGSGEFYGPNASVVGVGSKFEPMVLDDSDGALRLSFLGGISGDTMDLMDLSAVTHRDTRIAFMNAWPGSDQPDVQLDTDGYLFLAPAADETWGGPRVKLDRGNIELSERSGIDYPPDGSVRLYATPAGGGKTKLMAQFASGAVQQVALEP